MRVFRPFVQTFHLLVIYKLSKKMILNKFLKRISFIIKLKGCEIMNKLDIYKMILEIISEKNPKDFQELLDDTQKYQIVKDYIASDNPNQFLIQDIQDSVISMINDGLISGIISPLKYVTLIKINGLTIEGFQYLKKLKEDDVEQQVKAILQTNDQPMNSKTLTQALASLIF